MFTTLHAGIGVKQTHNHARSLKNMGDNHQVTKRKKQSLWLRGVLAGLCVAALGGVVVWFCIGQNKPLSVDTDSSRSRIQDASHPVKMNKSATTIEKNSAKTAPSSTSVPKETSNADAPEETPPTTAETNSTDEANNKKKKGPVFRNAMDQLLSMVMPDHPGDSVPPLPITDDMKFTEVQEKAMLERLTANDDDSDQVLERKEIVQAMRDEYLDLKKRGWTFIDYLKALQAKADLDSEVLSESWKLHDTVFNDPEISDAKYQETLEKINKVLGDRGIAPIKPPSLEDDDEEQQEEPKQEQKK